MITTNTRPMAKSKYGRIIATTITANSMEQLQKEIHSFFQEKINRYENI